LAAISNWAIDGAGIVTSLLGPGIGLALLYDDLGVATALIYTGVMVAAFGGFFLFLGRVPVRGYPNRPFGLRVGRRLIGPRRIGPFTPMVVVSVGVNALAGLGVLAAGS
jgi:hypothetical protein